MRRAFVLALLAAAVPTGTRDTHADPVALDPLYVLTQYASDATLAGDLCFADDGSCFASNAYNAAPVQISRIPAGGGAAVPFGSALSDPDAVLAAPGGVYVGASSTVYWMDENGGSLSEITSGGYLRNVNYLEFSPLGDLLASSLSNGNIVQVADDGTQSLAYETGLAEVTVFAFDRHGQLYVGTRSGPRVYRYVADNNLELVVETDHSAVSGILFDESDRMFVSDLHGLYAVDPASHTATEVVTLDRCEGSTYYDSSIYVSESLDHEVWRVNVVPEPFSMAFLGTAFVGVVGWRVRKRRKENATERQH